MTAIRLDPLDDPVVRCADAAACNTCHLFAMPAEGPDRDAWAARLRAEWQAAPQHRGRPRKVVAT
jgi:hypothetical protein